MVDEQCEVDLQLGSYNEKILCDVMPMDVCHILLGRPWKYDRNVTHEGNKNIYKFLKDGINHTLVPLQEEGIARSSDRKALLLSSKEFLQWVEENEVYFSLICNPK